MNPSIKKTIAYLLTGCVIVWGGTLYPSYGLAQEDMTHIDNSIFETPRRPPAVFNHDEHNERADLDCSQCHHVYQNGVLLEDESSEDQYCSDCHHLKPDDAHPTLMNAFHRKCIGCHKKQLAGPVMCGQCHPLHDRSHQ